MAAWMLGGTTAALLASSASAASTIYVDDSAAGGANNGSSWADAYVDLQSALAVARLGDEIRIAQGVYKPADPDGPRSATFTLVSGVVVQGGYAGLGSANPDAWNPSVFQSVLSGDLAGDDGPAGSFANRRDNVWHVITVPRVEAGTTLGGVIVYGGTADDPNIHGVGGGMLCAEGGTLRLRDCVFQDNLAYYNGAGIHSSNASDPCTLIMERCVIRRNANLSIGGSGVGVSAGSGSIFTDCVFENNSAQVASSGAAIAGSDLTFLRCLFFGNVAGEDGAAIFGDNLKVNGCRFVSNASGYWGTVVLSHGFSQIEKCGFRQNTTGVEGAAIVVLQAATAKIIDCAFVSGLAQFGGAIDVKGAATVVRCGFDDNQANVFGSAGGAISSSGSLSLINCAFRGNSAAEGGGAVYSSGTLTAVNCMFSGNTSAGTAGAILVLSEENEAAHLANCTISRNSSAFGAAVSVLDGAAQVSNCILWNNDSAGQTNEPAQIFVGPNGAAELRRNCIHGWTGMLGGEGNFGDDPLLIDPDGSDNAIGTFDDNVRLDRASPCRDAGSGILLPKDTVDLDLDSDTKERLPLDLDDLQRVVGGTVDLGAYEIPSDCPADIAPSPANGDGQINVHDLLQILNGWGDAGAGHPGDITGDGAVNVQDLLALLLAWGPCR